MRVVEQLAQRSSAWTRDGLQIVQSDVMVAGEETDVRLENPLGIPLTVALKHEPE